MPFQLKFITATVLLIFVLAACSPAASEAPVEQEPAAAVSEEEAPGEDASAVQSEEENTAAAGEAPTSAPTEEVVADHAADEADTAVEEEAPEPTVEPVAEATEEVTEEISPEATTEVADEVSEANRLRVYRIIPEESEASYAVDEEFFNRDIQFFTAVGVTNEIEGEFQAQFQQEQVQLEGGQFTVDISTLTSDSPRRDNAIRERWLQSNQYPLAEFTATEIRDFPETYAEGEDISFTVAGDMTIREVTQPMEFTMTARLEDNTITGVGVTNLLMKDFGFDPPNIFDVLTVTDGVTVTVEFTAEEVGDTP